MPRSGPQIQSEALHKEVEERAYALWEIEGRPQGRELAHWLKAESEVAVPSPVTRPLPKSANAPAKGGKKAKKPRK